MMKGTRELAFCMALALSLAACGTLSNEETAGSGAAAAADQTAQMGRWVENQVDLGGRELAGGPALLEDGTLVMFAYEQDPSTMEAGPLYRLMSTDNGQTWTEEDLGWNGQVEGFVNHVWMAADGTACVGSVELGEESRADNGYCFYLGKPGETLQPMQIPDATWVQDVVFYQDDVLLFQQQYTETGVICEMLRYDIETGQIDKVSLDSAAAYGGGVQPTVAGDKLLYLYYNEATMSLMELNPQNGTGTPVLDSLSEAVAVSALDGDAEGAVYYPTPKGIYRLAPGGTLPEQVMPGDGMALSVNSNYPMDICRAANGDFLVTLLGDGSTYSLYRYHYDETLPTHAETTLVVWSLQESATARAAINLYKQQHPEVDVTYTVAVSEDAQDPDAARNDALTQLNTELLAGNGPDLLILDGLDYETYREKGMLADLSDVVPLAELQPNLTEPFVRDGKVYAMPARFSVPVLIGDAGTLDGLTDLAAMEQAVLEAAPRTDFGDESSDYYEALPEEEKYALRLTSAEDFADFLLPVTATAILENNTLDEDALRQVMNFVQAVADYYGIKEYTMENTSSSAQGWTGSDVVSIYPEQAEYTDCSHAQYGWFRMDTPYSLWTMARRENRMEPSSPEIPCEIALRPGLVSGAYTPGVLVGVNAGSANLEQAKALAAAFFTSDVQGTYYSDGMTVRADCLADKVDAMLSQDQYPADIVRSDIHTLLESCTTPVVVPTLLRDSFVKHADAIIQGQESADDAVQGIRSEIGLYLAEQQ